jgi:hypothetical protein
MLGYIHACPSAVRLKKSGTTRELPHGSNRQFHAEP